MSETTRESSEAARALASLRRKKWYTCAWCGRQFEALATVGNRYKRPMERTCSPSHRTMLYAKRRRAAQAEETT